MALATVLLGSAGANAADGGLWLALTVGSTDPALSAEVAALSKGRRLGLVARLGEGAAYPLPGFVPVDPEHLVRGIRIGAGRGAATVMTLHRDAAGTCLLLDAGGAVIDAPRVRGEAPVLAIELPLALIRSALPVDPGAGVGVLPFRQAMLLAAPRPREAGPPDRHNMGAVGALIGGILGAMTGGRAAGAMVGPPARRTSVRARPPPP